MKVFLEALRQRNELLFYFGGICLLVGCACIVMSKFNPIQVLGVNAWFKPFKFLLSTCIFVWSMAWYLHYLGKSPMTIAYSRGIVVLFIIENIYILIQAMRGQTSHFNLATPLASNLWGIMVFSAIAISVWTLIVTLPFFGKNDFGLENYYLWGVRIGIIVFFFFSLEGMAMGARMAHSVGGQDGSHGLPVLNWSRSLGDLRVAHFMGMHALQVIPIISFYFIRSVKFTILFGALYLAWVIFTFLQALRGKPFW